MGGDGHDGNLRGGCKGGKLGRNGDPEIKEKGIIQGRN